MITQILLSALFFLISCNGAFATPFAINGDVIGEISEYQVRKEDNLYAIARKHDLGIVEVLAANPNIDPWKPKPGTLLTLPTMHVLPEVVRDGIIINLAELRLFYYASDGKVHTFPIGIGREGWETPTGETSIVRKRENPTWTPPASIRAEKPDLPEFIGPGPNNPLGEYAMNLGWTNFIIHGTNRPYSIGKRASHGCIRLYPEDIETLFGLVEIDTPVTVIDNPIKLGWKGKTLYLEVTQTQTEADLIAKYHHPLPQIMPEIYEAISETIRAETDEDMAVDWYAVEQAATSRNALPTAIAYRK